MSALFDTKAIAASNPPEAVFSKLSMPFIRRGQKLKSACPGCGKDKRFDYSLTKDVFNCFTCDIGGAGVINLVMQVLGRDFVEACKFLGGAKDLTATEKRTAEEKRKEHAAAAKRALANERRRTKAQMEKILDGCQDGQGTLAQTYLEYRGHSAGLAALGWPADIVFHPALEAFAGDGKDKRSVGHFPAMISKGRNSKGQLVLVHRTYLAPDGRGKADPVLPDELKDEWNAKQMVGVLSMCDSGVFIGASEGVTDDPNQPVIVAEGIESTLAMATAGISGVFYAALSLNRIIGRPVTDYNQTMKGWRPPHGNKARPVICLLYTSPSPRDS